MKKILPNILTISRILMVPFLWWCCVRLQQPWGVFYGLIVFIVAAITDYYDGKFARKYNISNFGKIMDPIADKALIGVAFYLLAVSPIKIICIWPLVIILARELVVTLLRSYYIKKNIYIAANYWGKLKTGTQIGVVIAAFVFYLAKFWLPLSPSVAFALNTLTIVCIWITVLITIASGATYFFGEKK